jgi:hypothetical protein
LHCIVIALSRSIFFFFFFFLNSRSKQISTKNFQLFFFQLFPGCCSKIPQQIPNGYAFAQDDRAGSASTHIYDLGGTFARRTFFFFFFFLFLTTFCFFGKGVFLGATTRGMGFGRLNRLLAASGNVVRIADGNSGTLWASGLSDAYGLVVLPRPSELWVFVSDTGTGIIKRYVDGGGTSSSVIRLRHWLHRLCAALLSVPTTRVSTPSTRAPISAPVSSRRSMSPLALSFPPSPSAMPTLCNLNNIVFSPVNPDIYYVSDSRTVSCVGLISDRLARATIAAMPSCTSSAPPLVPCSAPTVNGDL